MTVGPEKQHFGFLGCSQVADFINGPNFPPKVVLPPKLGHPKYFIAYFFLLLKTKSGTKSSI